MRSSWEGLGEDLENLRESLDETIGDVRELLGAGRVAEARNAADESWSTLPGYPPGALLLADLKEAAKRHEEQQLRLHDAEWFLKARELDNARDLAILEVSFPDLEEERQGLLGRLSERGQDLDETVDRIERVLASGNLIPALTLASRRRAELRGFDRGKRLLATLATELGRADYTLDAAKYALSEKEYERTLEILDAVGALQDAEEPGATRLRAAAEAAMNRRNAVLSGIGSFLDQGEIADASDLAEHKLPLAEALRLRTDSPGWQILQRLDEARVGAARAKRMAGIRNGAIVVLLIATAILVGWLLL